ncbi:putative 3-methyladenine DNA glycosylase isoform X2 [Megachile rotundata]|uniref:putative 3-methyladenine DNA glycosylase isoform X2 n=1 Tax=Megachile rotundata TaxID=143995 RepID=UPI000615034F|nr:PREDICTED: DNA-3-methyladenine glycosylase-like [Megachile rotundata]
MSFIKKINRQTFRNCAAFHSAVRNLSMKRTRAVAKTNVTERENKNNDTTKIKSEDSDLHTVVHNLQNEKQINTLEPSSENTQTSDQKQKTKLNFKSLKNRHKRINEELEPNTPPPKNKSRAVVDLEMMKAELKQLEDPPVSVWEKELSSNRLPYSFFDSPCEELAQNLLGKVLVRCLENGTVLKGRIVETESYLGTIDKASHTYQNKVTPRNIPMYMPPGTIYVYMTYGMYHCFNISSQGEGCAVLIRAVEPLQGMECMNNQRTSKKTSTSKKTLKELKTHELCNGPSKLCMAFQLHKNHSKYSLCTWKSLWIENGDMEDIKIVKCRRIGIDNYGEEWTNKPLRYYIYGSKAVSKRNKEAESLLGLN